MNWYEKHMRKMGYKGCRNCKHQIDYLRACEWLEKGGDGTVHLVCPRWEKKDEVNDEKEIYRPLQARDLSGC